MKALVVNGKQLSIDGVEILGYNDQQYELWVDLGTTEYYLQGDQQKSLSVSLTGMPSTSDLQYFTMIFDAKLRSISSSDKARIVIENNTVTEPENLYYTNRWGMHTYGSFFASYPYFFAERGSKIWTTDASATSLVTATVTSPVTDYRTSLWTNNTYSRFKIVCDRTTSTCHLYIADTYLGVAEGFIDDLIKWNQIYLYSDHSKSTEIAAVKNIKVAGFSTLDAARSWE